MESVAVRVLALLGLTAVAASAALLCAGPLVTALENVILSMDIAGLKKVNKKKKALSLLLEVGLDEDEAERRVLKLSGGQQQRVAIARALSYDPEIILADEPTGNLDGETEDEVMDIFRRLANEGKCVILVSHSPDVAQKCDEIYELKKMIKKQKSKKRTSIEKSTAENNE